VAKHDVIVIGGSSGSSEPLRAILRALPAETQAAVFVSTHIPPHDKSYLTAVLAAAALMPVSQAQDGETIETGRIYVAAPDRHLLLTAEGVRLGAGPRENMVRPSIDPLFRSAALTFGPRVVGVILSGMLNDGVSGLRAVQDCGGVTIVQDPADAVAGDMPRAVLVALRPDHLVKAADIGALLKRLAAADAGPPRPCPENLRLEVDIAAGCRLGSNRLRAVADSDPSTWSNCKGALSEARDPRSLLRRCQTSQAPNAETSLEVQEAQVETAMRVALRILEERVELVTRMAEDARRLGRRGVAELYEARVQEYGGYADVLRRAALLSLNEQVEVEKSG